MLSRIAESLYWIGRYIERAEDTARILDVNLHRILADPWVDEQMAFRSLLTVMGVGPVEQPVTAARVVGLLGLDESRPGSVVGALVAARENARGIREIISADMWECVNTTWHGLPEACRRAEQQGVHGFFRWVRERCALMSGLTDATMSRDEGWHFLVLGRSLERVDMTARLLSTHVHGGGNVPSWPVLLRSCGGWETFLRTYRGSLDDRYAAEFLLLDRLFPRSVFAALAQAESCLRELEPSGGAGQVGRAGAVTEARRLVGRARTDLEFRGADELIEDLAAVLDGLQRTCSQVNDEVSRRFFRQTSVTTWVAETVA